MGNTGKMTLIYTEIGFLNEWPQLKLALTEVPQVNHRVSKCFKGVNAIYSNGQIVSASDETYLPKQIHVQWFESALRKCRY